MILSFHPMIEGDRNMLCAGRDPGPQDVAAMAEAHAVILPQGCRESLYRAAREHCPRVFPNYDLRFAYPGKSGQVRVFQDLGVPHPRSQVFDSSKAFADWLALTSETSWPPPLMIKLDHGGEGDGVFPAADREALERILDRLRRSEHAGPINFVVQQYVPSASRSLRVAVIGQQQISYWRVAAGHPQTKVCLSAGGRIDRESDPQLMRAAEAATADFCRQTGVNLAGFDFIFSQDRLVAPSEMPLFLEINYFFGRRGLGGSDGFYLYLAHAVDAWLAAGAQGEQPQAP